MCALKDPPVVMETQIQGWKGSLNRFGLHSEECLLQPCSVVPHLHTPRDGQLIPQVCWAHLLTGQPFALDTCLPYFLAIGSNLVRSYLNKVPREEAKESSSQNHPEAKAKPALPEAAYFCTHRDEASLLS